MADLVSQLELLIPNTLTDAGLVSSTVPETDYPAYVAGTTYNTIGDRVIKNHHVYENLRTGNLGHDPSLVANRNGVTPWWNDLGATNRWAMFDQQNSTQTVGGSTLTVVMVTGSVGSIFSSNIDADYVDVSVKDQVGGTVIYTKHIDMDSSDVSDYDEYFFDGYDFLTSFLVDDIDVYFNPEVTVTYTKASGNVAVGSLFMGRTENLGETQFGVTLSPRTFSTIATDKFGVTSIVRRPFATDMKATAQVDLEQANKAVRVVQRSLDIPCVVIGSNLPGYEALQVYGLVSASFGYNYHKKIILTLSVNGMI